MMKMDEFWRQLKEQQEVLLQRRRTGVEREQQQTWRCHWSRWRTEEQRRRKVLPQGVRRRWRVQMDVWSKSGQAVQSAARPQREVL